MRKLEESASPSSSSAPFFLSHGSALVAAVLAFAIAQSAKIFTTRYNERRWDPKRLIGSGGMPSSHSATVVALAVAIGIHDGWGSSAFATATMLAAVVICDASGVRLHAGKQAEVLNQLLYELPEGHPLYDSRPLRELLGHTPLQVAFFHRVPIMLDDDILKTLQYLQGLQKVGEPRHLQPLLDQAANLKGREGVWLRPQEVLHTSVPM